MTITGLSIVIYLAYLICPCMNNPRSLSHSAPLLCKWYHAYYHPHNTPCSPRPTSPLTFPRVPHPSSSIPPSRQQHYQTLFSPSYLPQSVPAPTSTNFSNDGFLDAGRDPCLPGNLLPTRASPQRSSNRPVISRYEKVLLRISEFVVYKGRTRCGGPQVRSCE